MKEQACNKKGSGTAVLYAVLAAVFYALNIPFSKLLLVKVPPEIMAGLLYIGAGLGVGIIYLFKIKNEKKSRRLSREDLPYTLGMIALDVAAPILLMIGLKDGNSSGASLLGNFEIVATTLAALVFFKEAVSWKLWLAVFLITASSFILSTGEAAGLSFSKGPLFVLAATICWGFENNCTRCLSSRSTYQIVTVKGLCSGTAALLIGVFSGEAADFSAWLFVIPALCLGFVSYGLSIFTYVRAQYFLGAAKTSAYYALAPFIGGFLAFALPGGSLQKNFFPALAVMAAGTVFVVLDTFAAESKVKAEEA